MRIDTPVAQLVKLHLKMKERNYKTDTLPFDENLEKFAPSYTPENFTEEEKKYLNPFFSNLDKPVFVTYNLPEEINAALDSRYSRSSFSKRRLFIKEYVNPIINPEEQEGWGTLSQDEKDESLELKERFDAVINFLNNGGSIDAVVNVQRARNFFGKWLSAYGDDSIAEMGSGVHLSLEGISSVAIEEVVNKRIGLSPLVKSTRYVSFQEKGADGEYQYVIPGEIKGTEFESEYKKVMDTVFTTYSELSEPYLEYIKNIYPKGEDETNVSFNNSRRAKRLDDIRDLLPFSTQNNMGLAGNGRAYEDLVNRLLSSSLGELRWYGQQICQELEKVVPSFVVRPKTERGAEIQLYRSNLKKLQDEMSSDILSNLQGGELERWATLVSSTPEADIEILSTFIYSSNQRKSLDQIRNKVKSMTKEERGAALSKILNERNFGRPETERGRDRFKKVPRAFENAKYLFDITGRGGDMRDLHRHRQATEGHPPYTAYWAWEVEDEVKQSPFIDRVNRVLNMAGDLSARLEERFGSEVAQYAVPFAFLQQWYMNLTAREIYWIGELRTGPQARPHYKEITLDLVDLAKKIDPAVFSGIMVDRSDNRLARRESEKKIERMKGK